MTMILSSFELYAQKNSSKPNKKLVLDEVSFLPGIYLKQNMNPTLSDMKTLAPGSELLKNDFTGFSTFNYDFYSQGNQTYIGREPLNERLESSPSLSMMVGLKVNNSAGSNLKGVKNLRLGLNYIHNTGMSISYYKTERKTYDKFTSSQTGRTVYLDSVTTDRYNLRYQAQELRFDVSYLYRSNQNRPLSFFTGIGITGGITFNSHTDIRYFKSRGEEVHFDINDRDELYSSYLSTEEGTHEFFRNKSSFGASVYVPVGVDLRLGHKKELWKHMHVFYEARPMLNLSSIPELRTYFGVGIQHGLGLRYTIL